MNRTYALLIIVITFSHHSHALKYNRKEWKHWTDSDRNCLNTRNEVLKERSIVPVTMSRKGCRVLSGKWNDYYFPEVHTDPLMLDIDHLVPLKHAHQSGGAQWTRKEKMQFANDPENLVITNKAYNRQKGSKGINEWLPVHKDYACKYYKDWMRIKSKYRLRVSQAELRTDC